MDWWHVVGHGSHLSAVVCQCVSCAALRRELAQLREEGERRAQQDHDQCVVMFRQMQSLVQLNESLARGRGRLEGVELEHAARREELVEKAEEDGAGRGNVQRLQAIVVQQAREIETLRRRQRDAMADGRVRPKTLVCIGNQQEAVGDSSAADFEDGTDSGDDDAARSDRRSAARQLCSLPLTSLHAQLKGKDLRLQRLQLIIAKLETRLGQLVDRKRSMAQSFQLTARTQQAHLKKYLAYIRQQTAEKKALEQQVRELNNYVDVLEKKVVSSSLASSNRNG